MSKDPLELVGLVLDDRFRVESFVDEGELSVTYRGSDVKRGLPVAIRCLNLPTTLDPALADPFVQSFRDRTERHCRLAPGNSNVVQTLGSGTTTAPTTGQKVPFEIREWLEGSTLGAYSAKRRTERPGGWPLDEVLTLLDPVAEALSYIHGWGLTHGEINPNNLLVLDGPPPPVVKVLDFGEGRTETAKGAPEPVLRVLMPEFTAPEQVDKQHGAVGPWTDVFALAVVVLDCLAGGLPTRDLAAAVVTDAKNRPTPKKLGLKLPARVEGILERALSVDPKSRPADVAAFWKELKAAAAPTKPAAPKPPAPPNPLVKSTLLGLTPTGAVQPVSEPPPSSDVGALFSVEEAPTAPRDVDAAKLDAEAREPVRAVLPLESKPPPPPDQEPDVFVPALGRPSLGTRLQLAYVWLKRNAPHAWPWLVARARDDRPGARAAFGASVFGGCLLLALMVRLCMGGPSSEHPESIVASSASAATALPLAAAPSTAPAESAEPEPSTTLELPDEVPSVPTTPGVFTRAAATAALDQAASDVGDCRKLGTLWGPGSVRATFRYDGSVAHIRVGPPYADTPEGACVLDHLGRARVPPFRGPSGAVNYVFNLPK